MAPEPTVARTADAPHGLALPAGLARAGFAAMGTTVSVLAPADRPEAPGIVRDLFAAWEQTLSRFREDSELSRLNARAGDAVAVSPLLFEVTRTALAAAAATGGIFDPTMLRQLVAAGYDRSFDALPAFQPPPVGAAMPGGAWRHVALDPRARTVRLSRGVMLDFGGIAKGMAVDAALRALTDAGIARAAVEAGGDAAVAATPGGDEPWGVRVELDADEAAGIPRAERAIELCGGAIATSTTSRRRWRQGGVARHHLLDPRTGAPSAGDLRAVSAIAGSCAQAEVAAKVALILGADEGAAFIASAGLSALLVDRAGTQRLVGRWEPAPWDMASDMERST